MEWCFTHADTTSSHPVPTIEGSAVVVHEEGLQEVMAVCVDGAPDRS